MFTRVFNVRIVLVTLWLLAVGAGFALILNYQNAHGAIGSTPDHWPAKTQISLDPERDTLVMFAHPQCPCTRASVEELNRLLAQVKGRVTAQVWFFKPGQLSADWSKTGLWRSAEAIPGVTVHDDIDGLQAALFGAETSGSVFLYDIRGRLLFKGGITGSRGHAGDNPGEASIVSLCAGQPVDLFQTPVYGCSLLNLCPIPTNGAAK